MTNIDRDGFIELMKKEYQKKNDLTFEDLLKPPFDSFENDTDKPLFTREELDIIFKWLKGERKMTREEFEERFNDWLETGFPRIAKASSAL